MTEVAPDLGQYAGKTRQQLSEILMTVGGNAINLPDPDVFKKAWAQAPTSTAEPEPILNQDSEYEDFIEYKTSHPGFFEADVAEPLQFAYFKRIRAAGREAFGVRKTRFQALDDAVLKKEKIVETVKNSDLTLDYRGIAEKILEKHHVISFKKCLYRYEHGSYVEDDGLIDAEITRALATDKAFGLDDKITIAAQQVRHYLIYGNPEREYPFNNYDNAWCLQNGILIFDLKNGSHKIIDHTPDFKFNYKLVVKYNPDAPKKAIEDYIYSLESDDNKIGALLFQIPAHALLGLVGRVYKKAYFLKGERDSGKSTYLDMLYSYFFGQKCCSTVSLQDILYDRFRLSGLEGKILNSYADLSDSKIRDTGKFKMLTGGDPITIERKHKDSYDMKNKALLIFSANKYPKISIEGGDPAFWERWISILFKKRFKNVPDFSKTMFTEESMSGLLLIVLEQIELILKRGLQTNDTIMLEWMSDSNSADGFVNTNIERCSNAVLIKGHVWSCYIEYCEDNELNAVSQKEFTQTLNYKMGSESRRVTLQTRQEHCYVGVKWKGIDKPPHLLRCSSESSNR